MDSDSSGRTTPELPSEEADLGAVEHNETLVPVADVATMTLQGDQGNESDATVGQSRIRISSKAAGILFGAAAISAMAFVPYRSGKTSQEEGRADARASEARVNEALQLLDAGKIYDPFAPEGTVFDPFVLKGREGDIVYARIANQQEGELLSQYPYVAPNTSVQDFRSGAVEGLPTGALFAGLFGLGAVLSTFLIRKREDQRLSAQPRPGVAPAGDNPAAAG